ncbi:MAG: CIA30 family protein [Pseudomonadota bacterium]
MKSTLRSMTHCLALAGLLVAGGLGHAASLTPLVDDFSDATANSLGIPRLFIDDRSSGGGTTLIQKTEAGVLRVSGEIAPPRGQPGWSSCVLALDANGRARDASQFEGIRLRIRIERGTLSVSANSTAVTNYDYHAAQIVVTNDGAFHDVKIPFKSMKRMWSPQTPLDTATIASLSIVAFGMQKGAVAFELDEVGFY